MLSDNSKTEIYRAIIDMNIEKDHEQRTIRGGVVLLI